MKHKFETLYVIEVMLPDGPHWYGGIREVTRNGAVVRGIEWTPYMTDRMVFNKALAEVTFNTVCQNTKGAAVTPVSTAKNEDTRTHKGGERFEMRAKYLQVDDIVIVPGISTSPLLVTKRDDKHITLVYESSKSRKDAVQIGVNSDKWVIVTGKKQIDNQLKNHNEADNI